LAGGFLIGLKKLCCPENKGSAYESDTPRECGYILHTLLRSLAGSY
jgi:hypothetical protein